MHIPSNLLFLVSAAAGALTTFSIAPYSHWWLGILTLAVFAFNIHNDSHKKRVLLHAFLFGLGYFGTGVSWVFVSIHQFGGAPPILAGLMTSLFVMTIAACFALPFYGFAHLKKGYSRLLIGFPVAWALGEWLRSWLLTGFPWLYMGYGHIESPLVGWAPIGGVFLLGIIVALTSATVCFLFSKQATANAKLLSGLVVIIIWGEGASLKSAEWTEAAGDPISIGIVQPNIPQGKKWAPDFRQPTQERLNALSEGLWKNDWVIWPEAAIPDLYSRADDFIFPADHKARETNTSLITGVLYDDQSETKYYNGMLGLGNAEGLYFKQRLVPFGEYVPMEDWLRGLITFFDLPMSAISAGNPHQKMITAGNYAVASAICYEIVYPALTAELSQQSNVLLTVSNDAWFGESIGPLQHFHMARMRALEIGRYVIRSTNNGVSAIIAPNGSIEQQSEQFVQGTLSGEVIPMQGNTPYLIWKNYCFLIILLAGIAWIFYHQTKRGKNQTRKSSEEPTEKQNNS